MTNENPLKIFFRKSKFKMTLPSGGRWYPQGSITLNTDGTVDVLAMNADDDIRFRAGEVSLTGKSTLDLIHSCIPAINTPEIIPSIDVDSILLAIRAASYGDEFTTTVSVPNTKKVRKVTLKISDLLGRVPTDAAAWDDDLVITNEDGLKLSLKLQPIQLQDLFKLTKFIVAKQRSLQHILSSGINEEEAQKLDTSFREITEGAIDMIASGIQSAVISDSNGNNLAKYTAGQDPKSAVNELLVNMDVVYFNAIKKHMDEQRKKFTVTTGPIDATEEEIAAGASKTWQADIVFGGSEFFGG